MARGPGSWRLVLGLGKAADQLVGPAASSVWIKTHVASGGGSSRRAHTVRLWAAPQFVDLKISSLCGVNLLTLLGLFVTDLNNKCSFFFNRVLSINPDRAYHNVLHLIAS